MGNPATIVLANLVMNYILKKDEGRLHFSVNFLKQEQRRNKPDIPVSSKAVTEQTTRLSDMDSVIRRRIEEIMDIRDVLTKTQEENLKKQEKHSRRELKMEYRERRLALKEEEIRKSLGDDMSGFRGFERTDPPVDSHVPLPMTPSSSRPISPNTAPRRRTIAPLSEGKSELKREIEDLRQEIREMRTMCIRACRRAFESLPAGFSTEMETSLTWLLLSKLSGHAFLVTEGLRINRVEFLIERLKDEFLPSHGSNYYKGELAAEFMRPGEHMLDYFGRIIELILSVLDETTKNSVRVERRQLRRDPNLPPKNRQANKGGRYYCRKDGHLEDSCWQKKGYPFSSKPGPKSPSKPKSPTKSESPPKRRISIKKCQYCKNLGHLILECRKLKYKIEKLNLGNLRGEAVKDASRSPPSKERPKSPAQRPGSSGLNKSAVINNTLRCLNFKNMSVPFSRSESVCIPSRSSTISYCYVKNLEISEGYMPVLQLPAGIYAGKAFIKNYNGKGFFKISNTTSKQYMFEVPRLELLDFSEDIILNSGPSTSNKINAPDSSEILSFIHTIFTEKNGEECPKLNTFEAKPSFTSSRAESVRELLRLDHLNLEEARKVLPIGASDSGNRLIQFETKENQTDDEDSEIETDIDNTNVLDKTAGEINDLTESPCALTDTGETGDVCSDTGNSMLRGYGLHTVYGWSVHLIIAIWGSLTKMLIHIKNTKIGKSTRPQAEAEEL
ncbi:hypothetical protein M0804_013319 [Polistes exclamans]|nr:hypothetical protein M0804_013319 [Polistes exclamans]